MMALAKGCGTVWLVLHVANSNDFHSIQITNKGLSNPIISSIGRPLGSWRENLGIIAFSHDYRKLVLSVSPFIEMFDFDINSGQISNPISINSNIDEEVFGACFSPDNTKLYVSDDKLLLTIYQYDLNLPTPSEIRQSEYPIVTGLRCPFPGTEKIQIGLDQKLYVGHFRVPFLGVIENPNSTGSQVIFTPEGVDLLGSELLKFGIQNLVVIADEIETDIIAMDTTFCETNNRIMQIDSNGQDSHIWSTGEVTNSIVINSEGFYNITLYKDRCEIRDTIEVTFEDPFLEHIQISRNSCKSSGLTIRSSDSILVWSTGETTKSVNVSDPGIYWAELITELGCTIMDTVIIEEVQFQQMEIDTSFCEGSSIELNAKIYTVPGIYSDTIQSNCDTIFVYTIHENPITYADTIFLDLPEGGTVNFINFNFDTVGTYLFRTPNDQGCDSIQVIQIMAEQSLGSGQNVKTIEVSNIFSPNNDNINDTWNISLIENYKLLSINVFDRWGSKVFHSNNGTLKWDGTYKGEDSPSGVYFYQLIYLDSNGREQIQGGDVTLIR